jgi:Lar family restriction alleviation protein
MTLLKPCPFCGNRAEMQEVMARHFVACLVCGATGPNRGNRQRAKDGWQKRVDERGNEQ